MKKNTVKRFLALLAVAALMLGVFAGNALAAGYVKATGARVNVRSGPGEEYTDKWTMVKGEQVTYLGQSSVDSRGVTWYKVQYYSYGSGWVSSRYATLVGGSSSSGSSSAGYVKAVNGNVNVRSTPNLNGADIGTLERGETALYLGQSSVDDRGVTWYQVSFNGKVGWASSRYSELVGGYSGSYSSDSYVQAVGGDVNIRNAPSLSAGYVGVMYEGDVASYLGQSSVDYRGVTWYMVSFGGRTGWVSSRYSVLY